MNCKCSGISVIKWPFLAFFCTFVSRFIIMETIHLETYSRNTVEFVTVAAEFCAYMEQAAAKERGEFVDTLLKLLPLLYLKAALLTASGTEDDAYAELEQFVSEDDYDAIRSMAAAILGEQDDYLDVFVEDMKYSDTPIKKNISEDLADIYQDLRNFIGVYRLGHDESMALALAEVIEHFRYYWGQTLVNTMRALHDVKYNQGIDA